VTLLICINKKFSDLKELKIIFVTVFQMVMNNKELTQMVFKPFSPAWHLQDAIQNAKETHKRCQD
jgi:hypothetical protein